MARGWTRSFERPRKPGSSGSGDFASRLLEGLASIHERADEEEAHRELRSQMRQLFGCEDISLFMPDPAEPPGRGEGDWALKVVCGWGHGNVVCQADLAGAAALVPGQRVAPSVDLAKQGMLRAIALAYEEDRPWGLDVEEDGLVLLRDPVPSDDLGSGDLSILALPIRHRRRVGRTVECAPVGVLTLYRTPTTVDMAAIERPLTTLLAGALADPRWALEDPITTLFGEAFLRQELARQLNLVELTRGRLRGGFVAGWMDTLCLYRAGLEAATSVEPQAVSRTVSRLLRELGACVRRRASSHALGGPGPELRCGYPGRIGASGFGVVVPALSPFELCQFARALQRDVLDHRFEAEDQLRAGDVTVSLRVIPFGTTGAQTADALWRVATGALDGIAEEQRRLRGRPDALARAVGTLLALGPDGAWTSPRELAAGARASEPAPEERPTRAYEVDGVGTLLDEHPAGDDPVD